MVLQTRAVWFQAQALRTTQLIDSQRHPDSLLESAAPVTTETSQNYAEREANACPYLNLQHYSGVLFHGRFYIKENVYQKNIFSQNQISQDQ